MRSKAGAGDDVEFVLSNAGHSQITLDTTLIIQHLGVGERTDGLIHIISANPVEGGQRIWPF